VVLDHRDRVVRRRDRLVFERIRPAGSSTSPAIDALAKGAGYPQDRIPRDPRQPVGMFPHTDRIETVMAFERQ
jgi:hypothetical protein